VFAQEEQQLRRPRDDPFRRQAITRCRQPGRSLWLSGRRSWHDCIGDKALARIQPDRRCGARSDSPSSERRCAPLRTTALISRRRGTGRLQRRRKSRQRGGSSRDCSATFAIVVGHRGPIPAESQGRTRPRRLTQSRDSPPSGRTPALRPHRRKLVAARCAIRAREIRFGASGATCSEQKRVRRRRPLSACPGRERRAGGRVLREPLQRESTTYSAGGCSRGREGSDGCISRSDATGR
jgi:hypothetical protein